MRKKHGIILLTFFTIFLFIYIKVNNIYFFMNNTGRLYYLNISQNSNTYKVKISLDNLESNKGKKLYNQDGTSIVVEKVYKHSISNSKYHQYIVQFRSIPKCSITNGLFTSFCYYDYKNNTTIWKSDVQCKVNYKGKQYDPVLVTRAEGDQKIEYGLFNDKAIKDEVLENPVGSVEFIVTNLYRYKWVKR